MQNRNNPVVLLDENCDDEDPCQGKPVEKVFEYAWDGLQPSVFAFLGTDIKFELLKSFNMALVGLLVLVLGIVVCINNKLPCIMLCYTTHNNIVK